MQLIDVLHLAISIKVMGGGHFLVLLAADYGGFGMKKRVQTSCESCAYYAYDDDYECYICEMDLDEDELVRFLSDAAYSCPYYRNGDEYRVVRKQL